MQKNVLLTVIVPIYNVEKYLKKCLDSLVNQSLQNHHVILVNDGSTDKSGEIAQEYKSAYPDLFTYIEQPNQGLGAARNTGLQKVSTQYVTFLDSDDWQDSVFVERFTELECRTDVEPDLIFTLPTIYDSVTHSYIKWYDADLINDIFYPNGAVESIQTNIQRHPQLFLLEPNACRRIYSVRFLKENQFVFPQGVKWEDVYPHFIWTSTANTCMAMRSSGFFYRIGQGGQITASRGKGRMDMIRVFSSTLSYAFMNAWSQHEISYIIKMMLSYIKWSLDCSTPDIRKQLAYEFSKLVRCIPNKYLNVYLSTCASSPRRDFVYLYGLKYSKLYKIIGNYHAFKVLKSLRRTKKK